MAKRNFKLQRTDLTKSAWRRVRRSGEIVELDDSADWVKRMIAQGFLVESVGEAAQEEE